MFVHKKRYYSLDEFYKKKFGMKVFKVSLNAGFGCPCKDGTKGYGGCIFCNESPGIGDGKSSLASQFEEVKSRLQNKWPKAKYIAFLEANTNTYDSLENLKRIYEPLISMENVVGLSIATRCDAFTEEIYDYLEELNKRTYLSIELGLQSSDNRTLAYLNRGHTQEEFTACVCELRKRNIDVVVHIIDGLPFETEEMMCKTIEYVNSLGVQGIKFHMLYVETGTKLASMYEKEEFYLLSQEEYIRILGRQISLLDEFVVVHRLLSGPDNKKLIAPKWLLGKFKNLNAIEKYLEENDIWQGKNRTTLR